MECDESAKSEGELSEGELLSEEGEVSDEGELPESEPEEVPNKSLESNKGNKSLESPDKFDRYKIWQEAMVNNMRSAFAKVGDTAGVSSSDSSDSEEENTAFVMNDSEIPPNLRSYDDATNKNLLGALGVNPLQGNDPELKRKKKKKKKGAPSEWWERHKEIYEKMKERRLEMDAQRAKTFCRFFQKGFCKEGDECPFLHEIRKKLDVCKYFMKNLPCHKGDNCPYMHSEYPCKYFHLRGFCYNDKECRFSHEALTEDTKQIIEYLKNDRFDRTPRFKRDRYRSGSRSRSRSRSPIDNTDKPLFTDPDAPPSKKVLLPTPDKHAEERSRDGERNGRSPRYDHDRPYHRDNFRGNRGFFRGRGRGGRSFNGRFNRGFQNRRGNFNNHRNNDFNPGPNNFNQSPNNHSAGNYNPTFNREGDQVGAAVPNFMNTNPVADQVAPLQPTFQQQPEFVPLVNAYPRPPPPPPPPATTRLLPPQPNVQPATTLLPMATTTSDFGGNISAEKQVASVCAARDPRLKQNSEKQKASSEPSLADMFKSLDPTASPFG